MSRNELDREGSLFIIYDLSYEPIRKDLSEVICVMGSRKAPGSDSVLLDLLM